MRRLLVTVTAVITTLAIAGCAGVKADGDGVATAGGTPTSSTGTGANSNAGTGDTGEQMRRFATCMREHGVDMPDPEVDGEGRVRVRIGGGGQGAEPADREKVEAAQKACQQYLPNGGEAPKLDPEQVEKMRQFAKCMRENGVPNFPDPQADGSMRIEFGGGLDPESPAFQAAQAKCEQYMPRPPAGGGS